MIKEFGNIDEVYAYIEKEIGKLNIPYKKVYDHTENEIRVLIFQYSTLYSEVFIIHENYDLGGY